MNILLVASDNRRESGAFRSMVQLATLLRDEHNHNVLIVLPRKGNGVELLKESRIEYLYIPSGDWTVHIKDQHTLIQIAKHVVKLILNIFAVPRIEKIIIKNKVDIVHINTSWSYVGAKAALKTNTPFIWHIREFLEEDQERKIWNRDRGYKLMGKADQLIAISKSILKKYEEIIGKDKISLIYNGINPLPFNNNKHVIFAGVPYTFLIIGNVSEGKRQLDAVLACIELRNRGVTNFKLNIVGNNETDYAKKIRKVIGDNKAFEYIKLIGKTKTPEKYYKDADITFMCSEAEAFGRVTVEAMMSGSLVIGADSAGTTELIEDNITGLLYKARDTADLVGKVVYALSQPEKMKEISRNGQRYMLEKMTAAINANKISLLYDKIIQ